MLSLHLEANNQSPRAASQCTRSDWITAEVCSRTSDNISSAQATIVTTDFEALYAYKRGDYQRCLQLSTQNVHTLLYLYDDTLSDEFSTFPEIIQLLDDDIVSLTALTLIINPQCRKTNVLITLLTLSLYLMTQCQLKLRHSVTSLAQTLEYIEVVHRRYPASEMLNHLILKLTKQKALMRISASMT